MMNKIFVSAIVALLSLFTACDITGSKSEWSPGGEKASVRVVIGMAGVRGRTVKPNMALQDVTKWELLGGKQGDAESSLTEFSSAEGKTIILDSGTWSFTLIGYKEDALILKGSIEEQTISSTETNILNFTVEPILEGEGTLKLTVELPADSGITTARIFADGDEVSELSPVAIVGDKVVFEGPSGTGDYYISIRLYKDTDLYGVVSEMVHVWANLHTEKTYALSLEDLNLTYVITYHLWDWETDADYYQYTDTTKTLYTPSRPDYVFSGWYDNADHNGDAITTIPTGSTGNKDFYAKWTEISEEGVKYELEPNENNTNVYSSVSSSFLESGFSVNAGDQIEVSFSVKTDTDIENFYVGIADWNNEGGNWVARGWEYASYEVSADEQFHLFSWILTATTAAPVGTEPLEVQFDITKVDKDKVTIYVKDVSVTKSSGVPLSLAQRLDRIAAESGGNANHTITLNDSESIEPRELYYGGRNVNITLDGGAAEKTVSLNSTGSLFTIGSGVTLTLGNNVTLQGLNSNTASLVLVNSDGTLVMNNGSKISGNTVYGSYGGGVRVNNGGMFTMKGGEISSNTVYSSPYSYGGGVFVANGGTFTKQMGGIIYGSNENSTLKNIIGSGGDYGHAVYVDGSPAKIRNSTADNGDNLDSRESGTAGGWEESMPTTSLQAALTWLNSNAVDGGNYPITLNAGESIAPTTLSYNGIYVSITLNGGTSEKTISLNSTGSLFTIGSGVTLTLGNNVTLQGLSDNTDSLVLVNSGGTLVMNNGSKITENTISSGAGGGVRVYGEFEMNGGEISDNGASYGGGVEVVQSGTFRMNDGTIGGNAASISGGGVYNNGSFTMSSGNASDNSAFYGGGVIVASNGSFTMCGGTISSNTSSYGGGAYIYDSGTFTMSDGTISDNTADYGGGVNVAGGTFTKESGGIIYGSDYGDGWNNTATNGDSYGHAVYVEGSPAKIRNTTAGTSVTLDSTVSGSTGGWEPPIPTTSLQAALTWLDSNAEEGGNYSITLNADASIAPTTLSYNGIYVSITLNGGTSEKTISLNSTGSLFTIGSGVTLTLGNNVTLQGLSDNTASLVQVNSGGVLVMNGGAISNNIATSYGGGVRVDSNGTFTMNSGTISGNTVITSSGGGVYVSSDGAFTMNGGTISTNTTNYTGGGVYVSNGAFEMSGGTISGNTAINGGGVNVAGGTFRMSSGEISGNISSYYGGGVYVYSGTFTKESGGIIYGYDYGDGWNNTATKGASYGHAVYVEGSPAKIRNTTVGYGVTLDSTVSGSTGGWE
jgi:uncharacterized repeat protein (TIGR02543 family)